MNAERQLLIVLPTLYLDFESFAKCLCSGKWKHCLFYCVLIDAAEIKKSMGSVSAGHPPEGTS
jgi:hypothetical protein